MSAHLASDYFRSLKNKPAEAAKKPVLDGVDDPAVEEPKTAPVDDQLASTVTGKVPESAVTDDVSDPLNTDNPDVDPDVLQDAADYASADLNLQVAGALHAWAETEQDDLDDDETLADRLQALLIGIVDPDFNGDIDEDESDLIAVVMNAAADYLADKGVSDDDIDALLNDTDADAADRVQELIAGKLPDDADGIAADIDGFAFDDDDDDEPDDDAVLDATITAIRGGKKVRIKKRLSGRVRLSAKQKLAVRKMLKKSHSAKAQMRRLKSLRIHERTIPKKGK